MRDYLILVIFVVAAPLCFFFPYFGVLMSSWVAYFNPHRFAWGFAATLPVAQIIVIPTIIGIVFTKDINRRVITRESLLLLAFWVWVSLTLLNAYFEPLFADHLEEGTARLIEFSKIMVLTSLTILLVTSKQKLKYLLMVTAFSLGLLALKGTIFGLLTSGEFRVWGPPQSFIADNNDFGLALNMTLPITAVMAALALRSRYKLLSAFMLVIVAFLVISFAPAAWMARMGAFAGGSLDMSAQQRLTSWAFAWNLAKQYPITGAGFECFTPGLFAIFSPADAHTWLAGHTSSGPHSIYFQVLAEQGFVGLGVFLGLLASCAISARRLQKQAASNPAVSWMASYAQIVELGVLGYMVSGAFLGRAYFDLYYQLVAILIVLKCLYKKEVRAALAAQRSAIILEPELEVATS